MQKLALLIAIIVSSLASAQTNYQKGMEKAFSLWQENKPIEASNLFERIASAESDNWIPFYYAAQVNVLKSFNEKDKSILETQLNKAQGFIDFANDLSSDNAELMILQAQLHTAWIAFDGASYGMMLSPKVSSLYAKALEVAPTNPRVVLAKAEWDMGSARFFGQDTTPFCKDVEKSLELFATFKPTGEFAPNWGEERAKQIVESCSK